MMMRQYLEMVRWNYEIGTHEWSMNEVQEVHTMFENVEGKMMNGEIVYKSS